MGFTIFTFSILFIGHQMSTFKRRKITWDVKTHSFPTFTAARYGRALPATRTRCVQARAGLGAAAAVEAGEVGDRALFHLL